MSQVRALMKQAGGIKGPKSWAGAKEGYTQDSASAFMFLEPGL